MIIMKCFSIFSVFLLGLCGGEGKLLNGPPQQFSPESDVVNGAIGVLTYNQKITESVKVSFLNDDGTVWDIENDDFVPFSWHPDYGTLALRCIEIRNDTCLVVVDEKRNLMKKYPLSNKGLIFQTWEEHVLSVFSVGFNEKENPMRKGPSVNDEIIFYSMDDFCFPAHIKGDWLQLTWGPESNPKYGWIRWKENGKLLIELFYFA